MGFEALSCAIARVIIHYHAHQTNLTPPSSKLENSDNPLEHILGCSIDKMHYTIETKIREATSGNKTRLTLLEYMHFGFSLSEKARVTSNADDVIALQAQLVQFIQNLQCLLTTTFPRQLSIETNEKESLHIYVLTYSNSTAAKLTQEFFTSTGLSPESTEDSIREYIESCLERTLESLLQKNTKLQTQLNYLTKKEQKNAPSPPLFPENEDNDDWETIINVHPSKSYEESQKRHTILNNIINQLKTGSAAKPNTQTNPHMFCHTSPPPEVIMHNGTSSLLHLFGTHFFAEKTRTGDATVAKGSELDYA